MHQEFVVLGDILKKTNTNVFLKKIILLFSENLFYSLHLVVNRLSIGIKYILFSYIPFGITGYIGKSLIERNSIKKKGRVWRLLKMYLTMIVFDLANETSSR